MKIQVNDKVQLCEDAKVRSTDDGYLVAQARVARTGVQMYTGDELGILGKPVVRVYRPESEVFAPESISSYAHRPVTLGHPKDGVNSKNWRQLSVGQTGGEVVRDGDYVQVPMVLMDQKAIDAYSRGVRELSMGYSCSIELQDGFTPSGEAYDAVMRDLRMNHLAVVAQARGGSELKLGDETNGDESMDTAIKTRTVLVDGLSITTTEQGAQVVEKLQKQLSDEQSKLNKLIADHSAELAKRDAQIDDLKAKIVGDEEIDRRIASRAALVELARKISPKVVVDAGKTEAQIKLAVVQASVADAAVLAGKDEAYINARFDILAEDAGKKVADPVRQTLLGNTQAHQVVDADAAYAEHNKEMSSAWMGTPKVEA